VRKLAWFLIILFSSIPWIIALGLWIPPFGQLLHYIFVTIIGEGGANLIVGAFTGLFFWGSINGLQAGAVLCGIGLGSVLIWTLFLKIVWNKRPKIMKSAEAKIYQHAPAPTLPQVTPESVPQITKPEEEVKKEVPAE
jgi:hypothetical protein